MGYVCGVFLPLLVICEFHTTCLDNSNQLPLPQLFPSTQICVLFEDIYQDQLVLPKYSWIRALPLECSQPTRGRKLLEKTLPLSAADNFANNFGVLLIHQGPPGLVPQKGGMINSPLNTGICSGLGLLMFCTYCQSHCEFIYAGVS